MYTYDWTNYTFYDVILSRHKRDTNETSSSSSSEEDLFSESNKLAMYVVIPIMFLVYGGCACIYCCYKCRQYVKENSPKQIFKKFIGKGDNDEDEDDEEDSFEDNRISSRRENALKSSHPSISSSPGPDTDISYVDYDDTAMSTPGLGYPSSQVDKKVSIRVLRTINNEDLDTVKASGSDSGIQGDSNLTDLSGTLSSNKCITESIQDSAASSTNTASHIHTAVTDSYTAAPIKRATTAEMGTQTESVTIIESEQDEMTNYLSSSTHTTPCQEQEIHEEETSKKDSDSVIVMANVESSDNLVSNNDEKHEGTTKQKPNISKVRPRYMDVFSAKTKSNDTKPIQLSTSETNSSRSDAKSVNNNQNRSKWSGIRNILPKYLDLFRASKSNNSNHDEAKGRENKNAKPSEHKSAKNIQRNSSQSKENLVDNVVLDDIQSIEENNTYPVTFKGTVKAPNTMGKARPRYLDHLNQSNTSKDKNGKSESKINETSLSNVKAEAHATYIGSTRTGTANTPNMEKKPSLIKVSTRNGENLNSQADKDVSKSRGRGSGNNGKRTGTGNSTNRSNNSVSVISLEDMDPRQFIVPTWK